jgi:hypothetical protein
MKEEKIPLQQIAAEQAVTWNEGEESVEEEEEEGKSVEEEGGKGEEEYLSGV